MHEAELAPSEGAGAFLAVEVACAEGVQGGG